jgi:hypothetical protein
LGSAKERPVRNQAHQGQEKAGRQASQNEPGSKEEAVSLDDCSVGSAEAATITELEDPLNCSARTAVSRQSILRGLKFAVREQ